MNLSIENMQSIFIVLLVTLFVFILIRELICWYFKINERVKLQKDVLAELVKLNNPAHLVPDVDLHECDFDLKVNRVRR